MVQGETYSITLDMTYHCFAYYSVFLVEVAIIHFRLFGYKGSAIEHDISQFAHSNNQC